MSKKKESIFREALEAVGEVKDIRLTKSLFGKKPYPEEWALLRFIGIDIARGLSMIDQRLVTFPVDFFGYHEREKFANKFLSRARRNLERELGV